MPASRSIFTRTADSTWTEAGTLRLPDLIDGRILRRYKRFLADVELSDGRIVVAHVPNTGTMATCWVPGATVQLSASANPRRKLAWTLERVDMGAGWVGVNTARPNHVIAEGITFGRIPVLAGYRELRQEVLFEPGGLPRGRIDIGLYVGDAPDALVEVKNVTLLDGDLLLFPDAPTERGRKHLDLLLAAVELGARGVILFAANRPEGRGVAPANNLDPAYTRRLREVAARGVEVVAVRLNHGPGWIEAGESVPVLLDQ